MTENIQNFFQILFLPDSFPGVDPDTRLTIIIRLHAGRMSSESCMGVCMYMYLAICKAPFKNLITRALNGSVNDTAEYGATLIH